MNYFEEIKNLIEEREINKKIREIKDNKEDLLTRWNIGRLIVDAQDGTSRAKYGSSLIKEWGKEFEDTYGKSYSAPELRKMRQFYIIFKKCVTLSRISWNHVIAVLPLKKHIDIYY